MSRFTGFAMTGDGLPEINSLTYLSFETGYEEPIAGSRLALVLVEPRLLVATGDAGMRNQFLQSLRHLKGDLRAEGLFTKFISADVYRGTVQKDGRVLLAMRRFFRDVKAAFANFEGAILIGNFPEATLVRRVSWTPGFAAPQQLWIGSEMISERAEIVLADLTGNWESVYRQGDFSEQQITAIPDAATIAAGWFDGESVRTTTFSSTSFTVGTSPTFRDAFFMSDARFTILENRSTPTPLLRLRINQAESNSEVDISDRSMPNIIARPDIAVSRINAFHVAVNPNPALRGSGGETFLNASGNPQVVNSATQLFSGSQEDNLMTERSIDFERRVLNDYLLRNHRFRTGAFSLLAFRTGFITGTTDFHPDYYEPLLNAAATDFRPSVKVHNANLQQYVQFLKTPAVFKYIMAHSNARISEFRPETTTAALTTEVGGAPLAWEYAGGRYTPSFRADPRHAELTLHRALWHHNSLRDAGASLVVHGGCNVNSIDEAQSDTYSNPRYGRWNNAEGFLFFTNCVALMSRAKGFNDAPWGFGEGYRLSARTNFGSCWRSYFNAQANEAGLGTYNIQRKRPYFWSILGDWTLRLRNTNGIGILGMNPALGSVAVHPNKAWIDGWNFDGALNYVRGIGDVDGDGIDEFIVNSDWGIGILKYDGTHFRALMGAPRDTWFGGWRYDATINPGRDSIKAVQNFTGGTAAEILVWSSWGIATLAFGGGTLTHTRLAANGTRFGGWLLNTADNRYAGHGNFDSDGRKDVVLVSPWGIGIINLETQNTVFLAPNGTRFGGWLYDSNVNAIQQIADFDGDGRDEILVTSAWGIGILKLVGGTLTHIAIHANGTNLGGYVVNNADRFVIADNVLAGPAKQIVVMNNLGLHVLGISGSALTRRAFVAHGTRVDGWVVDTNNNNRLQPAGDLNGDGRAEFVIRSPWGIGIMGLDTANQFRVYNLFPNNSMLNDWGLQATDIISGAGNFAGTATKKELLFLKPI